MSKNMVQFQAGLSVGEFLKRYGTEERCREALVKLRWPTGYECRRCGHRKACELKRFHAFQCAACHDQCSVTADTIFHSTNLPLTKWFLAIYLMTQSKNGISQLELGRQVGVSINTAASMYHKIAQVMLERDLGKPLSGSVEADDAYWGGVKAGTRGRGSENKTPFVAAVEKVEDKPHRIKLSVVSRFSKAAIRRWGSVHLTPGTAVRTDGLSCFTALTEVGCVHAPKVVGNPRMAENSAPFRWVNTVLGNLKTALRGTFHTMGKDKLQRHLAPFVYRFNRRYVLEDMLPRFCYAALRTPPMPNRLLSLAVNYG
jgi:transposase-like protein